MPDEPEHKFTFAEIKDRFVKGGFRFTEEEWQAFTDIDASMEEVDEEGTHLMEKYLAW